ncbi:MAG: hypothetical protein BRD52_06080 [Bacteroidetes bacterium SW_4_67_19]|nr:MAG: hypothetical protein BRD52_06080 [Bacteroidetes bacterium SW_4_67_19]
MTQHASPHEPCSRRRNQNRSRPRRPRPRCRRRLRCCRARSDRGAWVVRVRAHRRGRRGFGPSVSSIAALEILDQKLDVIVLEWNLQRIDVVLLEEIVAILTHLSHLLPIIIAHPATRGIDRQDAPRRVRARHDRPWERAGDDEWVRAPYGPPRHTPRQRLTLTLDALAEAQDTLFLVSGEAKREVVHAVLHEGDPAKPASHVRARRQVRWLLDEAAVFA